MKYESSILKRLIDTYGVIGNPRYLSEIIKEFIVRGKELYPQLFTYQSDWLAHIDEFGLTPEYTVSYTGHHIYAPNTKEKPVKSAILSGSTKYRDIDTGEFLETFEEGRNLELVSVKMPVLKTTGKNLFDGTVVGNYYIGVNGGLVSISDCYATDYIEIKSDTNYCINTPENEITGFYDKDKNFISSVQTKSFLSPSNAKFLRTTIKPLSLLDTFQLEEGTTTTPYEPHKSNILSCNEEVELGSVGDVRDMLNLITGEVVERTEEFILNNSSNVQGYVHGVIPSTHLGFTYSGNFGYDPLSLSSCISNYDLKLLTWSNSHLIYGFINKSLLDSEDLTGLRNFFANNDVKVRWKKSQSSIKPVDLTIHDKDHQKVERLTSFDGGTHFTTSSQDGSLLPTLTVDVVTDLEKTMMVCSLEGNTM